MAPLRGKQGLSVETGLLHTWSVVGRLHLVPATASPAIAVPDRAGFGCDLALGLGWGWVWTWVSVSIFGAESKSTLRSGGVFRFRSRSGCRFRCVINEVPICPLINHKI